MKLPAADVLRKHLEDGLNRYQIAALYDCWPDTVRQRLMRAGLIDGRRKATPTDQAASASKASNDGRRVGGRGIEIEDDRLVLTRVVTAGHTGGTDVKRISLPFNSMHAAKLRE
ncbi:hypothetical protein [Rhizobium rhizogenes]|uniref:hypothetical protein n=1 Tax=Rhizobium rhizogenes TaxID=359 RepID=UPI001573A792|nr:hypothetical protein [Rhizobium rhizogenes]NTF46113.1 hypothetical protein [Rhizobium rhizogenes]